MAVEARVTELGDLLGKKLNTISRITEYDRLVDLEFGEEGIEAMDFLALFNEGVILGDTAQSEFIHEVDFVRIIHVLVREGLDSDGECCAEQHDLAVIWVELQKLFNNGCEFR